MEHRWSVRKKRESSVLVKSPNRGTAIGRMRDLGLGGMFIETATLVLPTNTPIDIAFALVDDDELTKSFRLQAIVVRRVSTGVGVMFLEIAADVNDALREVLYSSDTRPERLPRSTPTEAPDSGVIQAAG